MASAEEKATSRMMNRQGNLLEDPIGRSLFRLSWPMLIGMMAMTLFNLADTWYVAQIGVNELAAMTFTFPIVMILNGLTLGIGMGATAIIAQRYGAGDHEQVRKLARDSLLLALTLVIIVTIIGLVTMRPLFRALGADGEMLEMVRSYMRIWYMGTLFVVVPMVGNSSIRGTGDTKTPAWIMTLAAVGNIILDPLMIFGIGPFPAMGLEGAALATVISRALTMFAALYVLILRDKLVLFKLPDMKELWTHWRHVLLVGGPAALTSILTPLTFGILTRLIASFGTGPVAAFGAGIRVDMFALMVPIAAASGLVVFIGQNWGAGRRERVARAIVITQRFLFITAIVVWGLIVLLANPIASLFVDAESALIPLRYFLHVVEVGLVGDVLFFVTAQTYNALRRPSRVLAVYAIRLLVLFLPMAFLGAHFGGLHGAFIGMATARVLSGVVGWWFALPVTREAKA